MSQEITESKMQKMLNFAYDKAINGVSGLDSAEELASSYANDGSLHEQCNSLIRWQNMKAGTSGFVTGLGWIINYAYNLPLNITSVIYIQVRMIAAIAHLSGLDLKNDKVKTMVFVCLVSKGVTKILEKAGVQVGKKIAIKAIGNISGKVLIKINQKVGFRLITKFGEKGIINLGKMVPLVGGVIGASSDILSTNIIGNRARDVFAGKNT